MSQETNPHPQSSPTPTPTGETSSDQPRASLSKMIDKPVRVDVHVLGQEQSPEQEQEPKRQVPEVPVVSDGPVASHGTDKIRGAVRMVLIRFCEQFESAMLPTTEPLAQVIGAIEAIGDNDEAIVGELLPDVRELDHQIETLRDRVRQQHAYVLIFGPLKSGKSTFMNAMSGSYVSEVTALPAYPCMVYVMHAAEPDFRITNYAGEVATYTDRDEVIEVIEQAHNALTERSRQVESEGGQFDPMVDMPEAIRRIDVRVPAGDLAPSGAVLVDTPGLYSRMKFGYDRMTRDFRDSAACAVFIVKTDNLFLEQVFAEFEELLDLFSRIFLIVNLDASKQDLQPDGSLAPSLEHADPKRIIDAFETLSMSAQLKTAADDGRLQIYPVNLLGAASRRIRANRGISQPQTNAMPDNMPGDNANQPTQDFEALLNDLTEYLNSNEYVRSFMDDSIRRAEALVDEMRTLDSHVAMDRLASERDRLRQELDRARAGEEALRRLSGVNWLPTMQPLRDSLVGTMRDCVNTSDDQAPGEMATKIEQWFDTDSGIHTLERDELTPVLTETRRQWLGEMDREMDRSLRDAGPSAWLSSQRRSDFSATGLDATALARDAMNRIDTQSSMSGDRKIIDVERLPIHRTFWDFLLFRTRRRLRRQLFGQPGQTDLGITPEVKQKRLGDDAKQAMLEHSRAAYELLRADALERLPRYGFEKFAEAFEKLVDERLNERRLALTESTEELHARLGKIDAVISTIKTLCQTGRPVIDSLGAVRGQFCQHPINTESGEE